MKVGFRYTEEKKMITIARCLSEDYIHSSKLKNFCSSHGMTVSENKPELLRQIIEFAGEDESSEKYVETYHTPHKPQPYSRPFAVRAHHVPVFQGCRKCIRCVSA